VSLNLSQVPFQGVQGCGYLKPDGQGLWRYLDQGADEAQGMALLKIGNETFRVMRLYRLKLHRLKLSTPRGVLFLVIGRGITVGVLKGEDAGATPLAEVWSWLEGWLDLLENDSLAAAPAAGRLT
jgi:hypothetical protein